MESRKRKCLSISAKGEIIREIDRDVNVEVCKLFGLSSLSVSKLKKIVRHSKRK